MKKMLYELDLFAPMPTSPGLKTVDSSSSIHLASSLTIEMISKNNGGGGNHGGDGTIKSVDKDGKVLEVVHEGIPDADD